MEVWLRSIITVIILMTFVEMLLPEANISKYVNFGIGTVLLIILIQPIIQIKSIDLIFPDSKNVSVQYDTYAQSTKMKAVSGIMEQKIKEQIGIDYIKIKVNSDMKIESVTVKDEKNVTVYINKISRLLGITAQDITVIEE